MIVGKIPSNYINIPLCIYLSIYIYINHSCRLNPMNIPFKSHMFPHNFPFKSHIFFKLFHYKCHILPISRSQVPTSWTSLHSYRRSCWPSPRRAWCPGQWASAPGRRRSGCGRTRGGVGVGWKHVGDSIQWLGAKELWVFIFPPKNGERFGATRSFPTTY